MGELTPVSGADIPYQLFEAFLMSMLPHELESFLNDFRLRVEIHIIL